MDDHDTTTKLSRRQASDAVEPIGWRYLLGALCTSVPVNSYETALRVATSAVAACGADDVATAHLRMDLRPDRVELSLQTRQLGAVTGRDVGLARRISAALRDAGSVPGGATSTELTRPLQSLEIAIDALDIPAIVPFWRAVLAYVPDPSVGGSDALVDPTGQLPAVWFQQLDAPRPQRNRVHLDITVAHDEAEARVKAALAAGGRLLDDSRARSFWVLADAEGNEVCVCTWQDRDKE